MTSLSPQTVVAGVGVANGLWHRFRDSPRRLVECLIDLEARLKRGGSKAIVAVALTHLDALAADAEDRESILKQTCH